MDGRALRVVPTLRSAGGRELLLAAVGRADLLVLSYPLYVDSLPAPVIEAMEAIAAARRDDGRARPLRLLAIANSGFPEAHHNDVSLRVCRRFAKEAAIEWAGGLALGAGPSLGGMPLRQVGRRAGGIMRALDAAAAALDSGAAVPAGVEEQMAKQVVPPLLYMLIGNIGWFVLAIQNRALFRLWARPFAPRGG